MPICIPSKVCLIPIPHRTFLLLIQSILRRTFHLQAPFRPTRLLSAGTIYFPSFLLSGESFASHRAFLPRLAFLPHIPLLLTRLPSADSIHPSSCLPSVGCRLPCFPSRLLLSLLFPSTSHLPSLSHFSPLCSFLRRSYAYNCTQANLNIRIWCHPRTSRLRARRRRSRERIGGFLYSLPRGC